MKFLILTSLAVVVAARGGRHGFGFYPGARGVPTCGVPSFLNDLPEDVRGKVSDIWKDYKEGENCFEQNKLMRQVLHSLPKEVRRALFKPSPPFLRGASTEVKDQFTAIWKDESLSKEEKTKKFKDLAEKTLNADQLKKFNEFSAQIEKHRKDAAEKIEKLSAPAKAAFDELEELREKKHQILAKLSDDVKEELREAFGYRYAH